MINKKSYRSYRLALGIKKERTIRVIKSSLRLIKEKTRKFSTANYKELLTGNHNLKVIVATLYFAEENSTTIFHENEMSRETSHASAACF